MSSSAYMYMFMTNAQHPCPESMGGNNINIGHYTIAGQRAASGLHLTSWLKSLDKLLVEIM